VIIAAIATQGHGFNIVLMVLCGLISLICYSFIDDTDVIHSAISVEMPGEEVISEMQGVLDRWVGCHWPLEAGWCRTKATAAIQLTFNGMVNNGLTCPVRSSPLAPMGAE
jgi:hypothetical protein